MAGPVARVFIAKHKETNQSRGFAFVTFHYRQDAETAMQKLDVSPKPRQPGLCPVMGDEKDGALYIKPSAPHPFFSLVETYSCWKLASGSCVEHCYTLPLTMDCTLVWYLT